MKQLITGIVATTFFYFLFASGNKSWNTFEWSTSSLTFFGMLVFMIIVGWLTFPKD